MNDPRVVRCGDCGWNKYEGLGCQECKRLAKRPKQNKTFGWGGAA